MPLITGISIEAAQAAAKTLVDELAAKYGTEALSALLSAALKDALVGREIVITIK